MRDGHQAEDLAPTGDVTLQHDPEAARVELQRQHVGFEPRPLEAAHHVVQVPVGHTHVCGPLDDPRLILGMPGETEKTVSETIESLLVEGRTFAPAPVFVANALVNDRALFDEADADYRALMRMTEDMIATVARRAVGGQQITFGAHQISLQPPFARLRP